MDAVAGLWRGELPVIDGSDTADELRVLAMGFWNELDAGAGRGGVDGAIGPVGRGTRRIAGELGCSRSTVKGYLAAGGWVAIRPSRRQRRLDGFEEPLRERFWQHRGNLRCGAPGPAA